MRKKFLCMVMLLAVISMIAGCGAKKEKVITSKSQLKELVSKDIEEYKQQGNNSFPVFDFISKEYAMFHTTRTFYVYDIAKKKLISAVDLEAMDFFDEKEEYESIIQVSTEGSVVHFFQKDGSDTEIDEYYHIGEQEISDDSKGFGRAYQGEVKIENLGIQTGDSTVLSINNNQIAYLSYVSGVFMKTGEEFQNLCLHTYDTKTKKADSQYLFQGFTTIRKETNVKDIKTGKNIIWWKRSNTGVMYYDVDALKETESAKGNFGTMVLGNVFQAKSKSITITIDHPEKLDTSLDPVLTLNQMDDKEEPIVLKLNKKKKTYRFKKLNPKDYYYTDYYITKDPKNDKEMEVIDKKNAAVSVTISD